MSLSDRIVVDPDIVAGKATIKGTRIAVEFVVQLLAEGSSRAEIMENYPQLTDEDIHAALRYAANCLKQE